MSKYLIVAYQTAGGRSLRNSIEELASSDGEAEFVLLVPATHAGHLFVWSEGESTALAQERAEKAAVQLRESGINLTDVRVAEPDPFVAVTNELRLHPDYDTIIVSTFPAGISRWLRLDLPAKLERSLSLPVIHVIVDPEEAQAD